MGDINMSKYAYIVGACSKYTVELCALLNSLDYVGNKFDFHILGINLPEEFTSQFDKVGYKIIYHNISEKEIQESHGISEITCRKRYWYAGEIGKEYEAICVLDADMIFVRDPWQFFEIAAKTGFVLGVSKEQNEKYEDPNHRFKGEWIIPKGTQPESDLCNCPLFVDTKIWGEAFKKSWDIFIDGFPDTNFKAPDMAALNIMLLKYGSSNKTIALPNVQWLSTNEQALKLYQRAVNDRGKIKTETGIPIFSYHGHYGHIKWRECQLANRHHCAQGYFKASGESLECSDNIAKGSLNLLYERFKKMFSWKIKISPLDYRHSENMDYKKEYGDLWN